MTCAHQPAGIQQHQYRDHHNQHLNHVVQNWNRIQLCIGIPAQSRYYQNHDYCQQINFHFYSSRPKTLCRRLTVRFADSPHKPSVCHSLDNQYCPGSREGSSRNHTPPHTRTPSFPLSTSFLRMAMSFKTCECSTSKATSLVLFRLTVVFNAPHAIARPRRDGTTMTKIP